jgi:radical SAM protein with 4Fe4S-binding SPASM domain
MNEIKKIIRVQDSEIIDYIDNLCLKRDYIELKPVYIDIENPSYKCRSYDNIINLDGNGNIGGCLRQIPPSNLFGNIFTDRDPFNSKEMYKHRKLQHTMARTKITPHSECDYCFGNWC